ncbi:LANO_0F05886g1_1 [Lachancea nothofagi CBS 11611]|uniref:LANO_0F05886g1_1 n=1 Tax=Lachancea nothofagi CBS 11611 TaxID=1266666 RepID=A0A1G4K886_9SACH|nr:LANO_0F05886g1_1 [Lachancea nothofagi CBS 11611]
MSIKVPFKQVDVFTSEPYKGNPVAVINCLELDESEINQSQLQRIANWTNLSETSFLFKPTIEKCDYKLRIFTPQTELPFAGHPTLGSCRAYLEFTGKKNVEKIYQECKLGVIEITSEGEKLSFEGAKTDVVDIPCEVAEEYGKSLSAEITERPRLLEVGPNWVVALVKDAQTCYDMELDFTQMKASNLKHGSTGLIIAGRYGNEDKYEMRAFCPLDGIAEDPVCGSGSLALARYLQDVHNYKSTYSFAISQGGRVGREGKVSGLIKHESGKITYHVGGQAVTAIDGHILIKLSEESNFST